MTRKHRLILLALLILLVLSLPLYFRVITTRQTLRTRAEGTIRTLYVSTLGSDANPGTATLPWKTFYKAAQTAVAGDMVLFADGTYNETQTTVVKNPGTGSAPIIFKSQNKHKAVLFYRGIPDRWKIEIVGKPYVHIKDFEITQDVIGSTGSDKFINYFGGANYGVVSGNKIHHAYEDLVKIGQTDNVLVEDNILYDVTNEGFDQVAGAGTIFRNNTISNFNRTGIMVKGGARNVQIVSNTIKRGSSTTWVVGITIGGSSDAEFAYDPSGYEGYNIVAYNNILVAQTPGAIAEGLTITGCDNCSYVQNVVVGADIALLVQDGPGKSKGWTVDVHTRNPEFRNNIVMDCIKNAYWAYDPPTGTLNYDYNLIFNCPGATTPIQAHGVFSDPLFVNKVSDWHLLSTSPAIGRAVTLAPLATFTDANTPPSPAIDVSIDLDNATRTTPWDIGAYELSSPLSLSPTPTPTPPIPTNTPMPTTILVTPTSTIIPTPTPTRIPPTPTPTKIPSTDTTNPTVTITSPLNGSTVNRRSNVTINATATDNIAVDRVTFTVASNTSSDYSAPYSYIWSIPGKPNASYTIRATAYDASNNSSVSQIIVKSNK